MSILLKNGIQSDNTPVDLLISGKYISDINPSVHSAERIIDLKEKYILSGIIDPHVHMRDMDQSYKEDWQSGTLSALRGGITTVMDMPNTQPPTINQSNLNIKRKSAEKSHVNFGFNMGFAGSNTTEINKIDSFNAIKVFLCESSGGIHVEGSKHLNVVFSLAQDLNVPLIFHSESGRCIDIHAAEFEPTIQNHHLIRNRECAIKSTEMVLEMAENYSCNVYFAHVATAEEMDLISQAKLSNDNLFCEITPHHLLITRKKLESIGNWGRVNPPLRDKKDNERIYQAVLDGTVDTIGTDHAPHTLQEKNQDYLNAPSGFPGFETSLPLLLNEVNSGKISMGLLEKLLSTNAAEIFQLDRRGKIETGYFADLTIVDIEKDYTVEPDSFQTKAKYSPFIGMELKGDVFMTVVNGEIGYHDGQFYPTIGMEVDYNRE